MPREEATEEEMLDLVNNDQADIEDQPADGRGEDA